MSVKCKKFPIQRIEVYLLTINKGHSAQIVRHTTNNYVGFIMQSHY